MNSDKLRREIESILRGYYRYALGPSMAREPVLGAIGIARAIPRESGDPLPDPGTNQFLFESGAIDITNLGGGEYSANLFFGQYVVDGYTPSFDLNGIDGITNDDRFWPIGKVDISIPATPLVGDLTAVVGDAGASRVFVGTQHIQSGAAVPASLFSGRMRLYVQSLYGVKRDDISLSGSGLWPTIAIGDFSLAYTGTESQWLYVTDDWRFFVVWPSFSGANITFHFRELVERTGLKSKESALRTWAVGLLRDLFATDQDNKTPWELICLQSLVLALSSPDLSDYSTVVVSKPATTYPLGEPLAYGWHSTWVGDQAKIVLINPDTYTVAFVSTTLTVNITSSESGGTITFGATCSASEQTAKVDNSFLAWVPSGVYQASSGSVLSPSIYQCTTTTPGDFTIVSPPTTYSISVYGWYDDSGVWKDVKFNKESTATNFPTASFAGQTICHGESYEQSTSTGQGTATQRTITVGAEAVRYVTQYVPTLYWKKSWIDSGNSYWANGQGKYQTYGAYSSCITAPYFPGFSSYNGDATYWFHGKQGLGNALNTRATTYNAFGSAAFVLLHNDCEAAAAIVSQTGSASSIRLISETNTVCSPNANKIEEIRSNCSPTSPDGCSVLWTGSAIFGATTTLNGTFQSLNAQTTNVTNQATKTVTLVYAVGPSISTGVAWSVRTGDESVKTSSWSDFVSTFPTPNPIGETSGTADPDWEAFLTAPSGVCSAGNRAVTLNPSLSLSAVEGAVFSSGVPNPGISVGGYSGGELFIGAA